MHRLSPPSPQPIKKGSFYIAQYPVRWTAQSASQCFPSLADLFIPTPFSASPGSILVMLQLRAKTKSLTFPPGGNVTPLSIARYSFKQLQSTGASMDRTKMPNLRNGIKGGFEPLDCESGVLPLSYRAPHKCYVVLRRWRQSVGEITSLSVGIWRG